MHHERFIREEGMSEEEAQNKWMDDVSNPAIKREVKNGMLRLAVADHERVIFEQGCDKRQALEVKRETADSMVEKERLAKRARRWADASDNQFSKTGGDFFRDGAAAASLGPNEAMDPSLFGEDGLDFELGPNDSASQLSGSAPAGPGAPPAAARDHSVWQRDLPATKSGVGGTIELSSVGGASATSAASGSVQQHRQGGHSDVGDGSAAGCGAPENTSPSS